MNFKYRGKNATGKKVKGVLKADTRNEALRELKKQEIVVLSLEEASVADKEIRFKRKLKNEDFVMFLRQFSTLINAGISIMESTETMAMQVEHPDFKEALYDIHRQINRGESLSVAAARYPKFFPELLVNMVYAGEQSGHLDSILEDMAVYYEKQHKNKKTMVSSLMYPASVGIVAVILTIFLLTFIIPTFAEMFESFDSDIPAYTLFIMSLSDFLVEQWWVMIIIPFALFGSYKFVMQYEKVQYKFDRFKFKAPLVGNLILKSELVRMTQTLSMLMAASIPILQALEITERVASNRHMKDVLGEMREVLQNGGDMSSVMADSWIFPPLLYQMVSVGEKTGALDHMLMKVADFYEEEVDQLATRFGALIEPLMIVTLAVIVGAIVMAVIIPMFSLYESI